MSTKWKNEPEEGGVGNISAPCLSERKIPFGIPRDIERSRSSFWFAMVN
jgi:hypothetical protein